MNLASGGVGQRRALYLRRLLTLAALLVLVACGSGIATPPPTEPAATTAPATVPTDAPTPTRAATTEQTTEATATTTAPEGITAIVERPDGASATAAPASTVRFQFFGDAEEAAVYQKIAQRYMETHTPRKVEVINIPSQGDHMTRLAVSFTAGDPPEVFLVNYRRYGQFVANGVLEPLGPWMERSGIDENDFYQIALDAFRANGTVQCVPQNISSLVVYYNQDLFEQHGVPLPTSDWTWDTFLDAARQLTRDDDGDGVNEVHGVGVEPELIRIAPFIWQGGAGFVDDAVAPTKFTLDDERTRAAIDFFIGLRARWGVVPSRAEVAAEDLETRFRTGKLGMVLNSRRVVPTFRTITDFTWDVAALPRGEQSATVLHSDAYCMPAVAKDKEAAWDFIKFMSGPEGQQMAAELGRTVPSLKEIAASPAFLEPSRAPASSQIFLDIVPTIRVLPIVSTWPAIESAFNEDLEVAFYANDAEGDTAPIAEGRPISPSAREAIDTALSKAAQEGDAQLQNAHALQP